MKCVKLKSGKVLRVNNNQAQVMVDCGEAEFCPKWELKKQNGAEGWQKARGAA